MSFFEEQKEQSKVKSIIVEKYFSAWSKIMIPRAKEHLEEPRIAYIDLFAGPGRYDDGTTSTPLLILQKAISDPELRKMLVTVFNDKNNDNTDNLSRAIADLEGIDTLYYAPDIRTDEVGEKIVQEYEDHEFVPTFFFVDPWGYKGLSLRLVNSVIKDWGCECVFFFNYNRINMGVSNERVRGHMEALFGEERAEELRARIDGMDPDDREQEVLEALMHALLDMNAEYVLPFCFKNEKGVRTSHYLMFVTKNVLGYTIMKDIMAREGAKDVDGVPSLCYYPADHHHQLLFNFSRPLEDLKGMLLDDFAGRTLRRDQIFDQHHVGTKFIETNYRTALLELESAGNIETDPPQSERRKGTFAPSVWVTFPS